MERLIDAEALRTILCHSARSAKSIGGDKYVMKAFAFCINKVDAAPTIDPVRHGRWIRRTCLHENMDETTTEKSYAVCSECGKMPPSGWGRVYYCHNCGALMDSDQPAAYAGQERKVDKEADRDD